MTQTFKTIYQDTQTSLRQEPDSAVTTFEAETRQVEGFRSEATVRQFTFSVDEPETLGGTDSAPTPVELILAALGSCQEITYRLYADALGIPLHAVSVRLKGDLDLGGFFATDPNARPGYRAIEAVVNLDSPASEADLRKLKETVDRHCPVLDIIGRATPVSLTLARLSPNRGHEPAEFATA